MKKRIFAAVIAAIALLSCVPFLSGCKAGVKFTLNEDKASYTVSVTGFASSFGGEYIIPETYGEGENNFPVTAIAEQGFAGTSITKITIPKTVKEISVSAFMYCSNLREVVFVDGSALETIYNGAFAGCGLLTDITIPQTVKFIYPVAFMDCAELKSVVLPDALEKIGTRAFYNSGLEQIIVPENVFDETVPDLDEKGEQKKDEDGKLLTKTYMGIGYGAFHSCESLKLAVIKTEKISTLYAGIFGYCPALETVYLPKSVKRIEGAIFGEGALYFGHAFHHDAALKNVYFAGTEEEWANIEIENKEYKDKQVSTPYDNSAIINAQNKYFGQVYNG